jgi:AraC-like DNA-binding protein
MNSGHHRTPLRNRYNKAVILNGDFVISRQPMNIADQLMIQVPYGEKSESVSSLDYFWDSEQRGRDAFVIIQRTISGRGLFRFEGATHEVAPGQAFIAIIPESSSYRYPEGGTEPWVFSWINFYGPLGLRLARDLRTQYGPVLPLPERSTAELAFRALLHGSRHEDFFTRSEAAYGFMVRWHQQLQRPRESADVIEAGARYCDTFFRLPLAVKELAAQGGMSREHFTRLFTQAKGISPAAYLRNRRIVAAEELLRETALPLAEIAVRCGFGSARMLTDSFRSLRGVTPGAYRKQSIQD